MTTGNAYLFGRLGGFSGGVSLDEPLLPASSLTRNTRNTPPLLVELAGSTYVAPAKAIRTALDTHGPSRLVRLLDQSITPLKSARGVKFTADGFAVV